MNVTEITITHARRQDNEKLLAYVNIVLDGCFAVKDIKIIQGDDGPFISMPSRKRKDGGYADIAHPITSQLRRTIESAIVQRYREETENTDVRKEGGNL